MPVSAADLGLLTPELALCVVGLLVLGADMAVAGRCRWLAPGLALVGLVLCAAPVGSLWGNAPRVGFEGAFAVDNLSLFFKLVSLAGCALAVLLSAGYVGDRESPGEYHAFIIFLALGMCLLASANDLVLIYLSFELVSLASYVLAAWRKRDSKSAEAGMKYFIYGAAASAVMLYGLTLLYGAGGSTNLSTLSDHLIQPMAGGGLALIAVLGAVLMAVGLGFKISMAPFHAWAPDVYEGAPTPVTALLSVGPKAAGFAVLLRIFFSLAPALHVPWQMVFAVLATLTMFVGNLLAIRQTNIKRMLAYSSIAHAGYLLIGFVVGPHEPWGVAGILVYFVAYLLMNLGMFGVAILLERATGSSAIDRFAGLARSAPGWAALSVVLLLSLTGIPPTAGFLGKLYLFAAAIKSQQWAWLAVVGIVNSVISLYYYMNVVRVMYFAQGPGPALGRLPVPVAAVVGLATLGTVALFVFPEWLIEVARLTASLR